MEGEAFALAFPCCSRARPRPAPGPDGPCAAAGSPCFCCCLYSFRSLVYYNALYACPSQLGGAVTDRMTHCTLPSAPLLPAGCRKVTCLSHSLVQRSGASAAHRSHRLATRKCHCLQAAGRQAWCCEKCSVASPDRHSMGSVGARAALSLCGDPGRLCAASCGLGGCSQ